MYIEQDMNQKNWKGKKIIVNYFFISPINIKFQSLKNVFFGFWIGKIWGLNFRIHIKISVTPASSSLYKYQCIVSKLDFDELEVQSILCLVYT